MPAPGTPYTAAEIQRAVALQAKGHTWAQVASILGRTRGSLKVTVCMWRKGLSDGGRRRAEASRQLDDTIQRAIRVEGITTIQALADRIGMSDRTVENRLKTLGLDAETRRRLAYLGMPAAPTDRHPPTSGAAA